MKKILVIMLIVAMVSAVFVGCGESSVVSQAADISEDNEIQTTGAEDTEKPYEEEATTPENVDEDADGPLNYSIERIDWSIYNEDGVALVEAYYDLVTVEGTSEIAEIINETLQSDYDIYSAIADSGWDGTGEGLGYYLETYPYPVDGTQPFLDTVETSVTYNDGRYFSVECSTEWFMGGVYNNGYYGFVFDVATGEIVGLDTLFPDSLQAFSDTIWNYYYDVSGGTSVSDANSYIYSEQMSYDDFGYCIAADREIIILTESYAMNFPGSLGAWEIPTGILIEEQNKTSYTEAEFVDMFTGQWRRYDEDNDLTYLVYFGENGEMAMAIGWGRASEFAASGSGSWSIAEYSEDGSGVISVDFLLDAGDGTLIEYSGSLSIEADSLSPRLRVMDGDIPLNDGRYGSYIWYSAQNG